MLIYSQTNGTISKDGSMLFAGLYAGRNEPSVGGSGEQGKNSPEHQQCIGIGPLPQGQYTISPLHTVPHLGPCMALTPAPTNQMFGRSGFFIHLDNPAHVGESSDGCIVAPSYVVLNEINDWRGHGEDQLTVIAV